MPIEFDFSSMYRKRGCCRKHVARSPTIKRISDASCGLDDGLLDMLRPGMKLLQVDEDRKGALSELSLAQLLGLLEDNTEKISLRFEAVNVVQKMEAWATSQVMCAALLRLLGFLLDLHLARSLHSAVSLQRAVSH
jgi:hypothetical protein